MVWLNNLGFADPYGTTSSAVDALFSGGAHDLGNGLRVVRVGDDDERMLSAVIECLATSECGTTLTAPDPLLDWVYHPRDAGAAYTPLGAPPSAHRLQWFRWLVSYSAYFALARGGLYALVEAADPRRVMAAAVTGPPGTIPYGRMSGGEMGDWCQKAGMEMAIEVLANNMRNRVLGTWQGQAHGDAGYPHLEIVIFGTAPEYQGRGLGATLLRFLGEVADADGVPTHLETAGSRNVGFYTKKGGFEEVHRSPVASFNHEGGGVAMQRAYSGARAGGEAKARPKPHAGNTNSPHVVSTSSDPGAECSPAASVVPSGSARSGNDTGPSHAFKAKRSAGPLASYCSICGGHRSAHDGEDDF